MANLNLQRGGWYHSATAEAGYLGVKPFRGQAVAIPFRQGYFQSETSGTSTAVPIQGGLLDNGDGTGTGLSISVPGTLTNGVQVTGAFMGPVFGLRIRQDNLSTMASEITVEIDGVAYTFDPRNQDLLTQGLTSPSLSANFIIVDDLDPGPHVYRIIVTYDVSGGTTRTLVVHGILVDANAGYALPTACVHMIGAGVTTLSTSNSAIIASTSTLLGVEQVDYINLTASARVVTISYGSSPAAFFGVYLAPVNTDGFSKSWKPPKCWPATTLLIHKCDANSSVNFLAYGPSR